MGIANIGSEKRCDGVTVHRIIFLFIYLFTHDDADADDKNSL